MPIQNVPKVEISLKDLNDGLETCNLLDAEIRKAKQAGLDIADTPEQAQALRQRILQVKRVYFPGK